ncbi:hypothetical protein [Kallotenue papyrolyticum]|uniref:hypothetical protein n=1 Tax=Kallotenue papyrolyticum TaxID=1325125 RepID=UPI0004AC821A|nr:hypothetical protein [Kallotenue papyrolyticum]
MRQVGQRPLIAMIVGMLLCVLAGFWPQSGRAARATVVLADANRAWSAGRFFRTGLALDSPNGPGGVLLVPTSIQPRFKTTLPLPVPLSSHASATYGNRIFVVGGDTLINGQLVKSARVFSARLLPERAEGDLEPWEELPPLPVAVADPALVIAEVGGQPFLIVLGGLLGRTSPNLGELQTVSTKRIFFYPLTMDEQGRLGAQAQWAEAGRVLPHAPDYDLPEFEGTGLRGSGAYDLMAAVVPIAGQPYLYIFGGHNRTFNGSAYQDAIASTIYRAPLARNGSALQIGAWDWSDDSQHILSETNDPLPLAGAVAVSYSDPLLNKTAVYLTGGYNAVVGDQPTRETHVYVAVIDGANPATPLSWHPPGSMSAPRDSHGAIQFNGIVVLGAGRDQNGDATTTMAAGYLEADLSLYRDPNNPNAPNFEVLVGGIAEARALHTMATLNNREHGSFGYIIGGEKASGSSIIQATPDVLVVDLDQPPQPGDSVVSEGTYTTPVYDFGQNAKYYSLNWKAIVSANYNAQTNPIQLAYRVGNDPLNLPAPVPIPVRTVNGVNTFTFNPNLEGRYIQFVATLKADTAAQSPILDQLSLELEREGFPNLKIINAGMQVNNTGNPRFIPNVTIGNKPYTKVVNGQTITVPALPANWDGEGTLYVDMYITRDNGTGTQPNPPTLGQAGTVYAKVDKASLPVNAEYTIPVTSSPHPYTWRPASCAQAPCPLVDWNSIFSQPGRYHVWVMVDSIDQDTINAEQDATLRQQLASFGRVVEAQTGGTDGETDNTFYFSVDVTQVAPRVLLPLVVKSGTGIQSASEPTPTSTPRGRD